MSIILVWVVLAFLFTGSGFNQNDVFRRFWFGYALTLVALQLWHLFFPVNLATFIFFAIGGLSGLVLNRHYFKQIPFMIIAAIFAIGLSYFAANGQPQYDDGLYHAQDLLWTKNYAIVPGLGLLHGRLAFNNSHTLFMALIDSVFTPARQIGNGLLLWVILCQIAWSGWQIVKNKTQELYHYFFVLFIVPFLYIGQMTDVVTVSSLKNDLPVSIIAVLLGAEIVKTIQHRKVDNLVYFTVLACAGVTVKLSFAVLGALMVMIMLALVFRYERSGFPRAAALVTAISAGIIGIWMVRGVLLSGYPLYPLTLISLPVEWQIMPEVATHDAIGITSWARIPGGDYDTVMANWDWLTSWWERNSIRFHEFIFPILLGIVSLIVVMIRRQKSALFVLLLPVIPAIIAWFISAPDVRFGWHNFWLFGVSLFLINFRDEQWLRSWVGGLVIILLISIMAQISGVMPNPDYPEAPVQNFYTYHGLRLHYPYASPQCWDAPLPCTPYPDYALRLRQPGNMQSGFVAETIASDKGAFALTESLNIPDIVPTHYLEQLKNFQMPVNGLLIGHGWHGLEDWGSGRQRWAENDAQIYVTNPDGTKNSIHLLIAPGPSLKNESLRLSLLDENKQTVDTAIIQDETTVEFNLPLTDERVQIFYLHTDANGIPAENDGRILNFRVMEIAWN